MTAVSATTARTKLYRLIDQVNEESEPLTITGQRGNAVLVGEDDWRAIQETLFLANVPGFTESIRQARAAGLDDGSEELDW
ncbi:MAG: type II toxin-antitoxin system Phd/YefM family antitoxin [Propionibacteriaceae bacterium]|jgi:prevent-host-death family protein|nr:type II toxin-antitoxin system Phd/YefM family antitoxin [Propionibacteriaceae bacterium]